MFRRPGFTLVELIVVISLLIMASAAVIPSFIAFHRQSQLSEVVRRTITFAAEARGLAVARETQVELLWDARGGTVEMVVEPTEADLEAAVAPDAAPASERQPVGSRRFSFPEDIEITVDGPGAQARTLRFFPDGRSEPVTLRFERERLDAVVLAMNPRTGRLQRVEAEP